MTFLTAAATWPGFLSCPPIVPSGVRRYHRTEPLTLQGGSGYIFPVQGGKPDPAPILTPVPFCSHLCNPLPSLDVTANKA